MSIRRPFIPLKNNAIDLSGLSINPYFWLDMSEVSDITFSGNNFISKPNKGTFEGNWTGSNNIGATLPHISTNEDTKLNVLSFLTHGPQVSIGTAADAKFLHDGTQYIFGYVGSWQNSGTAIYSTVDRNLTPLRGTFLFTGNWGTNFQNSMLKAWYGSGGANGNVNPSSDNASPVSTPILITESMRGHTVSSGNKSELFMNGNPPFASGINNNFVSAIGTSVNDNPYKALTVGHFSNAEPGFYGLKLKQLVFVKYSANTPISIIDADRIYLRNQLNSFYSVY